MTAELPDGLGQVLGQLAGHTDSIARLDERDRERGEALADLVVRIAAIRRTVSGQEEVLRSLSGLAEAVDALAAKLADDEEDGGGRGYKPIPAPRWHELEGDDREAAIARLRSWVGRVYLPTGGHLAAGLGECWPEHPLALAILDWLSELWSLLYLQPKRSARDLSAQAEFGTRIMPAAAALLTRETRSCRHAVPSRALPGLNGGGVRHG